MSRKIGLKMYCEKCQKNTVHETRVTEEGETHVCLKCEIRPVYDPREQIQGMNRMNFAEQMWLNNRRGS
jgi:hypothetical protein